MISLIGWLASLVALITGLAMLQDSRMGADARAQCAATLRAAFTAVVRGRLWAVDPEELRRTVRQLLGIVVLMAVVAASGVLVLLPSPGDPDPYGIVLRCALAAFMAMQAPCPWIRFITVGASDDRKGGRRVL